jgi:hypothetical protein
MPNQEPYPSDLNEVEWELLRPLVNVPPKLGRPPRHDRRLVLNAILQGGRAGAARKNVAQVSKPVRPAKILAADSQARDGGKDCRPPHSFGKPCYATAARSSRRKASGSQTAKPYSPANDSKPPS